MPQIIPEIGVGERIGTALGTGLGRGLQSLADLKMKQLIQQQQQTRAARGLEALQFSPEEAMSIAGLEPGIQREIVKQRIAAPSQQAFAESLSALLGAPAPEREILPSEGRSLAETLQPTPVAREEERRLQPHETISERTAQQLPRPSQREVGASISKALTVPHLTQDQTFKLAQIGLQQQQFAEKMATQARKEKAAMTKEQRKDQARIDRETLPYHDQVNKEARGAKANSWRLDRMNKLNEEGNLGFPALNTLVKTITKGIHVGAGPGVGLDLTFLMTADAQEMDKLATDFLKNIKDYFGSRILQTEIENFLKTVPSLTQSKEGRRRLINDLQVFNQAALSRQKAMNEILEENNGVRPRNLEDKIEKRIAPRLDALHQQFKEQQVGLEEAGLLRKIAQSIGLAY